MSGTPWARVSPDRFERWAHGYRLVVKLIAGRWYWRIRDDAGRRVDTSEPLFTDPEAAMAAADEVAAVHAQARELEVK